MRVLSKGDRGRDVKRLQFTINKVYDHFHIDRRISVDGILGPATFTAAHQVALMCGAVSNLRRQFRRGIISPSAQKLISQSRRRSRQEQKAFRRRKAYRKRVWARYATPPGPKIYKNVIPEPGAVFGSLGTIRDTAGHYDAARKDTSDQDAIALCRSHDSYHRSQGWGGMSYHYCITSAGNLILLRPVWMKGAHVLNHNTGTVGILMPGTTGDRPTGSQAQTLKWLLDNAHTGKMPSSHRVPKNLMEVPIRGHLEFPGQATSCPGLYLTCYKTRGARIS